MCLFQLDYIPKELFIKILYLFKDRYLLNLKQSCKRRYYSPDRKSYKNIDGILKESETNLNNIRKKLNLIKFTGGQNEI